MSEKNPFKLKQAAVRMVSAPPLHSDEPMNSPESAIRTMAKELKDYDREVVAIINLKSNLQPINFSIVSMGALNESVVHPREMLKSMFLSNAASIIMVHNHPSGNLTPSKEDVMITDRIQQLCSLAGVSLMDHIIIGGGNERSYYSMHAQGEIPANRNLYTQNIEELKWSSSLAAEAKADYPDKKKRTSVLGQLQKNQAEIKSAITKQKPKSRSQKPEL